MALTTTTYYPKQGQAPPKWHLVDAEDQVLGRLASRVASLLRGKNREDFTPYAVFGDHVIIVNASKIRMTGGKVDKKVYRHYSGYPGGLKEVGARRLLEENPGEIVREAVIGMLPKNKAGKAMGRNLLIYADDKHPHEAQKPEAFVLPQNN